VQVHRCRAGVIAAIALLVVPLAVVLAWPGRPYAQPGIPLLCSWPVRVDEQTLNVFFPDAASTYWVGGIAGVPGSRFVVRGQYPAARYFSLHAYDARGNVVGALADDEIERAPGEPARYSVEVQLGRAPAAPGPNTIYTGRAAGWLVYRVYLPNDPASPTGGVGLPQLQRVLAGRVPLRPPAECAVQPPGRLANLAQDVVAQVDLPSGLADRAGSASDPPELRRATGAGLFANRHVAYLAAPISRELGEVLVMRFWAPSAQSGAATEGQLRYWSVCSNEALTTRVVACTHDQSTALTGGFATIVVSDPARRPTNAVAENGITWLPRGIADIGILIYRHMLPNPAFAEAIQNVPLDALPDDVMGIYAPATGYCTTRTFESGGPQGCLDS